MAIIDVGKDFQFGGDFAQANKPETPALPQSTSAPIGNANDRDFNDVVNTVIAEAGGEGPEGMAAVASVIKNRAATRNQGIGDVVRAPKQFEGYENPGEGSRLAQQDPAVRSQAEQIVRGILDGSMPDPTGGADHFKNDSANPDWAAKMPAVARIGKQTFYNSGVTAGEPSQAPAAKAIENQLGLGQEPQPDSRRGLARLVPPDPEPKYEGTGGALHFNHPDQDKLNPAFNAILKDTSKALGMDFTITSGYRSPQHPIEAAKEKPGEHALGEAADIDLRGMNDQQRAALVQDLRARGVKRFGTYSDSPNMLHVDLKDQTGKGGDWFMHDRTARLMNKAPAWFQQVAQGKAPTAVSSKSSGKAIEVGADFVPQNPMGLIIDEDNPFGIQQPEPEAPAPAPDAAQPDATNPMLQQLEAKEPGRYKEMTQEEYGAFKKDFDAKQPWLITDMTNYVVGGAFKGISALVRTAGQAANIVGGPTVTDIINPIFGTNYEPSNGLTMPADWLYKFGDEVQNNPVGVSAATREAVANTNLSGDILKPSTWSLGEKPSARGFMALGLDIFGQMLPIVAGAALSGGSTTVGMALGGAQGGGSAEQTARETIDEMAKQPGMLERESAYYREQIAAGKTRRQAIDATKEAAGKSAFMWDFPVSALGGAMTTKLIHPASHLFEGGRIATRVAGRAVASGFEEGSQEVGETIATRHGVNEGVGTDLDLTEGTFSDFVLGALGGAVPGAGGGLLSKRAEHGAAEDHSAEEPATPEAPKGPLARAAEYGAQQNVQKFTVNDGPIGDSGPGAFNGQTVTLAPDQTGVSTNMRRVVLPDGRTTVMGNNLLGSQSPRPLPAKNAAPDGAPKPGATVRVDAPGVDPFMGRIDSYQDGEAQVIDSSTGEVMQIPVASLTQIAAPPEEIVAKEKAAKEEAAAPAERPIITQGMRSQIEGMGYTPEAIRKMTPEQADDILKNNKPAVTEQTMPAAEPVGGERKSTLPPESDQIKAASRPQGPPMAGERVIVQAPGVERFSGRIERWEDGEKGPEAVVTNEAGTEMQVSVDDMYVTKETAKQAEQEALKNDPPVEREKIAPAPENRTVGGKQMVMPDALHAQLFDLGKERITSKRLLGTSALDLDRAFPAKQGELADKFGVTPETLGKLADDYRYRVERAAKESRSDLPVNMHELNAERLKTARAERTASDPLPIDEAAEAAKQAKQSLATWWDSELNDDQRKDILAKAGVKRSEKFIWKNHKPNIQAKLAKYRAAAPVEKAKTVGDMTYGDAGLFSSLLMDGVAVKDDNGDYTGETAINLTDEEKDRLRGYGVNIAGDGMARISSTDTQKITALRDKNWTTEEKAEGVPKTGTPADQTFEEQLKGIREAAKDAGLDPDATAAEWIADREAGKASEQEAATRSAIIAEQDARRKARKNGVTAPIDIAAHEAATSPQNDRPEPSQAQKEAGNYKLGHVSLGGMDISIENPAGSERKGVDSKGKAWAVKMKSHYGYFKGTIGRDKDHIDTFVKPGTETLTDASPIFVVDQQSPNGTFDEHKVMTGYANEVEARVAYNENYAKGWKGMGDVTATTLGDFKRWLSNGDTTKPFAPQSEAATVAEAPQGKQSAPVQRKSVPQIEEFDGMHDIVKRKNVVAKWLNDLRDEDYNKLAKAYGGPDALARELGNSSNPVKLREQMASELDALGTVSLDNHPFSELWNGPDDAIQDALSRLASQVKGGDQRLEDEVARAGTDAELLAVADSVFGTGGATGRKYMLETRPGPKATIILDTDDGPQRHVLEGKRLADALRKTFNFRMVEKAPPTPDAPKPTAKKKAKAKLPPLFDRLENYFQPGRIVQGYGGLDKVIGFERDGDRWKVRVIAVDADGVPLKDARERVHATQPDTRELVKWERDNPVPVDQKADTVVAKPDTVASKADSVDQQPDIAASPVPADWGSTNKLVSRDRADEVRAKLRAKLNGQISSGIDPEILALGTELAAFHIEAGARRFADFAKAVALDMGVTVEKVRPFLRAWYNGARDLMEDSGIDIAGTDDAEAVKTALAALKEEPANGKSAKLGGAGSAALEGIPSEPVQGTEGRRDTGRESPVRGEPDLFGSEPAGGQRVPTGRGVADGARGVSTSEAGRSASEAGTGRVTDAPDEGRSSKRPADDANQVDASQSVATPAADRPVDYTISDADELGQGGAKSKFRNNVAAVKLLRTLESENRPATRDEQSVLAKWVGWGGLRAAFAREDGTVNKGWEKEASELKELLTPEEFRAAESSTRNAHYTSPEVVEAMWRIAQRLGFQGGQVLEPSVGAGNFLGLMPGALRDGAMVTGVELDHITGGIAKNLYPAANIQAPVGFQELSVPDGHFDLAIGNPPFGSERLYDKARRALNKFSIHNFFFAKSVDALKPNGVLAMVVTNAFLDGADAKARQYISDRANLLGAIRLPNNAFLKNAGTEVTTDIILLQKRLDGEASSDASWVNVGTFKDKEGRTLPLNDYFTKHPDMMLGDFGGYGSMYRADEPALVARPGEDLAQLLDQAIGKLPDGVMEAPGAPVAVETVEVPDTVDTAQPGSMFLSPDGTVHIRGADSLGKAQSSVVDLGSDKAKERVAAMIRIRDAFARLRRAQIDENATDAKLTNLRKRLNEFYDALLKKHGPINSDANRRLFRDDPTWPQISALEEGYDKGISAAVAKATGETARGPSARKAPIFTKRTQEPYRLPTTATSAKDALATVLADRGHVDLDAMSKLYGKSADAIVKELGPLVYKTPAGSYTTADDYLSGNVKQKLAEAQRAAEIDPDYRRNVAALRDVIPADIEPVDIDVKPGAPWLPANHVADFVDLITDASGARAFFSKANAKWVVEAKRPTEAAAAQYGTDRTSVQAVLDAAMNGQAITVRDTHRDGTSTVNQAATDAANEKLERVKAEWKKWLWTDDARREQLSRLYNDTFNTDVLRTFDGSHLSLPGKVGNKIIELKPNQINFVWRTLQSGTALADHTVGAGKTFALIASIMEKRRIGQAKKPMLTVPNHLVGQWAADFIRLYPGAKVLAATKKDFEAENRKRLFARVATGDWDVVIVAHSSFGKIGVTPEFEAKFIQEQVADMEASIGALREATGEKSRNVGALSKARDTLVAKLQRLLDAGRKDDGLYFDELGVDALYVDEFHEFKNLAFSTSMQRVAGLGNAAGSQKAADMYQKIAIVLERTGGQNVVTATGTPLSNTMAEMFTLQRYLDKKALKDLGVSHFDAWARVFGDVVTDWELSPSGQYKLNSRFARFVNMPELMQRYLSFADVINNDDIKAALAAKGQKFALPRVKGGKPQNVVVERSNDQARFIGEGTTDKDGVLSFPSGSLVYRAENLPKKAEKGGDNMLKVMSDARKAALDMRLIDPSYPDRPGSKVHIAADNIKRIYDAWNEKKGTQLVFIDLSTPQKAKAKEAAAIRELMRKAETGDEAAQTKLDNMSPDEFDALESKFSVYDDLKEKLIRRGVPENEIAFIHDANTDLQKEELFGKVRSGRIRVLLGSTPKMGAGTNVQNRLVALHHLDAPWRPSDLEQRDGRGIRQGNDLYGEDPDGFEIEILRYATKNTLDARQWQTIEGKARFIQQMRKGGIKTREVEDIAGEAANSAEMKAAASGNPLILEEMDLRQKVRKLEGQSAEHDREQHRLVRRTREMREEKQSLTKQMVSALKDAATATEAAKQPFSAVVQGETFEKQKEFGAALVAAGRAMLKDKTEEVKLGKYAGFDLTMVHDHTSTFTINIDGADLHEVVIKDIEEADALGTAMKILNTVRRLPDAPLQIEDRISDIDKSIPALEKQIGPWSGADQLTESSQRHREVLDQLKPKPKPASAPATEAPKGAEPSLAGWDTVDGGTVERPALDEAAQQEIRDIIKEVSGLSDVAFTQRIDLPNGAPGWGNDAPTTAAGFYDPSKDAITIALDSGSARVAFHEAFHRLQRLFLTSKDRNVLKAEVGRLRRIVSGALGREAQAANMSQKELEAEAFAIYAAGKATIKPHVAVRALWDRIATLVRRVRNLLVGRGFQTAEDVFDRARSGETSRGNAGADSQAFSKWFGQSKVVDNSGKPLVVYHGSNNDIEAFEPGHGEAGRGLYFSADPKLAGIFSSKNKSTDGSGRSVYPVYLRIENPLVVKGPGFVEKVKARLNGKRVSNRGEKSAYLDNRRIAELKAQGYDGIVNEGVNEIVAFDPTQIKSVNNRGTFDPNDSRISYSIAESRIATITQEKVIDEVRGKLTDIQPKLLKAVPLNYFTELAQPNMTAVDDYLRTKRALDAYRGHKQADADTIAKRWLKYVRVGLKSNTTKAAELADMMHTATLAGVDPAKTDEENTSHPRYQALRKQFIAMAPAARELYIEVREAYKAQAAELDKILLDNVRKAHEITQRKAEAAHREEIERIEQTRMSPSARQQALEDAEKAYVGASTRAGWSMKARLTKMRVAFEASRVQEPYFPLARHGRYFVTVRDVDGTVLSFSRRENAADRNRLAKEMRESYPNAKVDTGVMESGSEIRQAMDPRILAEIQTILGGTGLDGSTMNTVLDQIWQRYLETMPDLSTRKKFIHRKGTAGFDGDALRAFGSHMFHAAHQMGRLKYGMELQELTNNAADQARKADNPDAGMTLANELKNRHDWVMNPMGGQVAQIMSSTAFVWYLAASPASALVNMTQTPMLGIPMLAGRFGSFTNAAAAIAKASLDSVRGKGSVTDANLTPDEKNAMQAFYNSGMIDKTQAHDLAGVGETGVDYSVWRSKVMGVLSWAFHKTEVWNREVTALAAYRMARSAGQNQTDAINTAHDLTWKTHFDYSNSNRPAIMQNDFMKVVLTFRTHNINMLYRVTRDLHQAFKGATPAARKEARYQLAGVFGMMSLLGGVTGVMGFNIAMMIAGAIFGDDDDPLGFEQEFRKSATDILGPELAGVVLNGAPGHYLGVDLTSRIGMPDLWFRSPPRELQGQGEYQYWVMNTLGATVGMGGNMWNGFSLIKQGEVARGIEAAAPKVVKDLMKSYRYATEGVQNIGGDEVLAQSEMDPWDFIAQAVGFTPAKVTETYDRNSALKNAEARVLDKRRALMNAYALAATMHDDEGKAEVMEKIKRFNAVPINRPLAIGADTLHQSLKTRARNAAKREDGALIANPRLGKMLRERLPERIN